MISKLLNAPGVNIKEGEIGGSYENRVNPTSDDHDTLEVENTDCTENEWTLKLNIVVPFQTVITSLIKCEEIKIFIGGENLKKINRGLVNKYE